MTEFKEGDLVRAIPRLSHHADEVGLIVDIQVPCDPRARIVIGVVWPHVADTRWYWTRDLVKVTG